MVKRPIHELVTDMLRCIEKITRYTAGLSRDSILNDDKTVDALIRNVELLGEIANQLGPELWECYPTIPWREMIGMRNKLIHDYVGVNIDLLLDTVEMHIPNLEVALNKVLSEISV